MATASSAQREPSMEEILASIRRIIEDSDSVRKVADDDIAHEEMEASAPVEAKIAEVDAFRAELAPEPEVGQPVSLADIQAQIAVEAPPAEAAAPAISLAEVGAIVAEENPAAGLESAEALVADWKRDLSALTANDEPASAGNDAPAARDADDDFGPAVDAASPADAGFPEFAPALAPIRPAPRSAILSERTERQVAAAFGELSEAFAARSKKTFDDMAEAMLRPMLQEWLDNNLPTLVERLVREEIERVARGGQ